MTNLPDRKLELLAPAKNLEYGREAVNHGADALYVGAPAFGARSAATNTLADIGQLVRYAHLYGAKVFATVNTLLFDDELEAAADMVRRLYEAGVDALIIQDMGLLECDLPPIELHASTQCHNADRERIKFMEQVGFRRVILARETSLEQMRAIRESCSIDLEAFVHGALCVSYSGQCYLSQSLTGRSGNRGCCSQPCRSAYDLYAADGRLLLRNRHLLSLKDFNASRQLGEMVAAGITSFKIEGRLKDLAYVKNVTAYYRQLLDNMMEGREKSSSGQCTFHFLPDVERTFNRGYTDYFLRRRQPLASMATQKSIGKPIGTVAAVGRNSIAVDSRQPLTAGDGLCFLDRAGSLQGFSVNGVDGKTVVPNAMPDIEVGAKLWRNHDHAFEKTLLGKSAERKIGLHIRFRPTEGGFAISLEDEDGLQCTVQADMPHTESNDRGRMTELIAKQLGKLGETPFVALSICDETEGRYFLAAGALNQMRRDAVSALVEHRINHFRPKDCQRADHGAPCPADSLDYRANIINDKAELFYKSHGARVIERGVEQTGDYGGKALMTTKYCLRHELGCCLKQGGQGRKAADIAPGDTLLLHNNGRWLRLDFDCRECLMRIFRR